MQFTRRDFLKFLGLTTLGLAACDQIELKTATTDFHTGNFSFKPISATTADEVVLPEGFSYKILKSWGDEIAPGVKFGFNNDYTAFFSLTNNQALLWVNHEYVDPEQIPDLAEQKKNVGGSIFTIEKDANGWKASKDEALISKYNRRYDANSPMLITGPAKEKYSQVFGTLANCSGGKTPWGTVLTCEENFNDTVEKYKWQDVNLEHYGWVVEIDPYDPEFKARKHSALGRFAHENAGIVLAKDGRVVVYMGDDHENEHLYKFISTNKFSKTATKEENSKLLSEGKLYVAKMNSKTQGSWLEISLENPKLKDKFSNQAELLINARKAAKLLDATPLARPEDVEVSPIHGSIFVSLTQNYLKGNLHGSIMKITEKDYADLEFKHEEFLLGGKDLGLSCPDNMAFDNKGNLWLTTDIKGLLLDKVPFKYHGNNSLFVIPTQGINAGKIYRFASAPPGAEFTGPSFSDDYKTLFLSVQHPGEDNNKSLWPHDPKYKYPRPSVIAIQLSSQ